ncbi:MAG: tail fiber domain-containing protein [Saprospiraceae bacterium]|nr:tail fiber domain-containing protein [Saprospiraceae bacterium]
MKIITTLFALSIAIISLYGQRIEAETHTPGEIAISGTNTDASNSFSRGVLGKGYTGVVGIGTGSLGYGVYGTSVLATGIFGVSHSTDFSGVRGANTVEQGISYGVHGTVRSINGYAVYGYCSTDNVAAAVLGSNASPFGIGVEGKNGNNSGTAPGVYGHTRSASDNSTGVLGQIRHEMPGGFSAGVRGINNGTEYSGIGVHGEHAGNGAGVYGQAKGSDGIGVWGFVTSSSTGWGGYFLGGKGLYAAPRLGVNNSNPLYPIHVGDSGSNGNGAHLTTGGTWTNGSSRSFKEGFEVVDVQDILEKTEDLRITTWQYSDSDEGRHMGPIAEDFAHAFGLGTNDKYISTVDTDGVALACIQALCVRLEKEKEKNSLLAKRVEKLEKSIRHKAGSGRR